MKQVYTPGVKATASSAKTPLKKSKLGRNIGIGVGVAVLVLLLVVLFGVFWLFIRPLPQTDGTIKLAGLKSEVKITRDKWGVPHINAANADDLFFAEGYVHAQDRLWQMDFHRRIGAGRLSEVLGESALKEDLFLRVVGLRRAAEAELAQLAENDRAVLESYARGVNAFISSHQDNLPVEFTLLGYKPEPWTVLDSTTWGKVMSLDLSGNYDREILRAALVEKLGAEKTALLMAPNGVGRENTPLIVPAGVSYKDMGDALALQEIKANVSALSGGDFAGRGSNNWVVSGSKTTTGKPLLANDPHLGIRNPSIWYEVELNGGGYHVAGVSFAGAPGVVSGHNERIAWGITNVEGDTQDIYMEKPNPANPNQYDFKGVWQDYRTIKEEIKIAGKPSRQVEVKVSRHGPIINEALSSLKDKQPMALQWSALQNAPVFSALLKLNRAGNWNEFREALRGFNTPAQNFVYADVDGNIGYQVPGLWPLRAKGDGKLPVPGWTGEYDWTGYVDFENLPTAYNPPAGFVATANNRPVSPDSKTFLGDDFDAGWRAERIVTQLKAKEKLSVEDMKAIQSDVVSLPGQQFAKLVATLPDNDPKTAPLLQKLRTWDGKMTTDSVGAAVWRTTHMFVLENLFKEKMGDLYLDYISDRFQLPATLRLMQEPGNEWWGSGGRDAVLKKSLGQAADYLTSKIGSNIDDWRWGKLHNITFAQTPIGTALPAPLQWMINLKNVETNGDGSTVAAANFDFKTPFLQKSGQSFRGITNFANFDQSQIVNSGGQSGQPFNSHYGDQIDDWRGGGYHPWLFTPAAIEANKSSTLSLQPA